MDLWTVQDIKDPDFITEAYIAAAEALVDNDFLTLFDKPSNVDSDKATVRILSAEKRPARLNKKGSQARTLDVRGIAEKSFFPYHSFDEITLNMAPMEFMQQDSSIAIDEMGRGEIARQLEDFGKRHRMMRAVTLAKTLTDGIVYIGPEGEIYEGSTGAAYSVDLGVSAAHKTQLDDGSGDIIGTAWDDASAKILTDLDQIVQRAEAENLPRPRHVFLNHEAKKWFRDNTELQGYFQNNETRVERFLSGDINDINGFTFHFINATYQSEDPNASTTNVSFVPAAKALITPEPGPWLRAMNHPQAVPTASGVFGDINSLMGNFKKKFGPFAFTSLSINPPAVQLFMGDNWFFGLAEPDAVWIPTVDF